MKRFYFMLVKNQGLKYIIFQKYLVSIVEKFFLMVAITKENLQEDYDMEVGDQDL